MKYLLDTHAFLWTLFEDEKLSNKAKSAIRNLIMKFLSVPVVLINIMKPFHESDNPQQIIFIHPMTILECIAI